MLAKLHGVRPLDFTAQDGKQVRGTQLFISFEEQGVTGHATDKLFVRQDIELPKKMQVGKDLDIYFDRKGKVEAVYDSEQTALYE